MKEALLESSLRKMRLNRVLPTIRQFKNPSVLDIGCGWEARLLREIEPYIAKGVGIDFKAPSIETEKLRTFSYFFEVKVETGGGGESYKDSACSDKGLIASRLLRLRTPSARPCKHSQSKPFSSTILESRILESKKTAQSESPTASSFALENKQNAVFIAKILESKKLDSSDTAFSLSLRGGGKATNEAIHKKVESNFANLDSNMDCHADKSARNDSNSTALDCRADLQNTYNDKRLDSSEQVDSKETSPIAERYPLFCHATATALARNDRENSPYEKLDSSDTAYSPSSRADEIGEAIHNSAQAESNAINNAHKVRYLESVVGGLGGVRGDKGGELANSNPLSPLQKNSLQVTPESSESARKVESSQSSSRAFEKGEAIHNFAPAESNFAKLDSMDRHDFASAKSRNDSILDSINNARNDSDSSALNCRADLQNTYNDKRLDSSEQVDCHDFANAKSRNDSDLGSSSNGKPPCGRKSPRLESSSPYVFVFFALVFGVLLLFFGYAYPSLPFWGDDWQYLSTYGTMKPGSNGWIPDRILPLLIHAGLGVLCAYVAMPLSGLDFVESMTITSALVLSASTLGLMIVLYRLLLTITRAQILALFGTSAFVIIGFCASKASFMPLFLPADLQAEGVGYTITLTAFYILPNLLNLALLALLMRYQFAQILHPSGSAHACKSGDPLRALMIGAGAVLLYLSQFSMTSSALILASYCGISLLFAALARIKQYKSLSPLSLIKSFGFYELVLALGVGLFLVAVWYGLNGGRGSHCGGYDFGFGLTYTIKHLKSLRSGFWVIFVVLTLFVVYLALRHRELRATILAQILWLVVLSIGYMGIVSSCGAKHYLMSGLLLSVALLACVWLSLLLRFMPKLIAPAAFVVIFSFLHPFEGYVERPRDSYLVHKSYAQSWVAQVQEAESKGLDSVSIFVPKELPHWQWEGWFFPWFVHTLRQFGVIRREIKVEFKPIE